MMCDFLTTSLAKIMVKVDLMNLMAAQLCTFDAPNTQHSQRVGPEMSVLQDLSLGQKWLCQLLPDCLASLPHCVWMKLVFCAR